MDPFGTPVAAGGGRTQGEEEENFLTRGAPMPIYTRLGDGGETGLYTPKGAVRRVPKDDLRVEAYGTVDELNAQLGVLKSSVPSPATAADLGAIQNVLFHVGYDFSTPSVPPPAKVTADDVRFLEERIDAMTAAIPPLKKFILPAGGEAASRAHVARTVCRRAERRAVSLAREATVNAVSLAYLNRLSDYLFTLARALGGEEEDIVEWRP